MSPAKKTLSRPSLKKTIELVRSDEYVTALRPKATTRKHH
jgi:hypothetical protein